MKRLLLALSVLTVLTLPVWANGPPAPSINYGDSCRGPYGATHKRMSVRKAIDSLKAYFIKRDLSVRVTDHRKWFIRAEIYNTTTLVDIIIMDVRTGKMRSIY
jgi:hypothetical protein